MSEPTKTNNGAPAQFKKTFKRLSTEQQEVIADLVRDINQGNVNPVNVANRDAARIALARFEGWASQLPDHECALELSGYEFSVALEMTPTETPGAEYIVTKTWTLKGLRYQLARERFFETITCDPEDEQ